MLFTLNFFQNQFLGLFTMNEKIIEKMDEVWLYVNFYIFFDII